MPRAAFRVGADVRVRGVATCGRAKQDRPRARTS